MGLNLIFDISSPCVKDNVLFSSEVFNILLVYSFFFALTTNKIDKKNIRRTHFQWMYIAVKKACDIKNIEL